MIIDLLDTYNAKNNLPPLGMGAVKWTRKHYRKLIRNVGLRSDPPRKIKRTLLKLMHERLPHKVRQYEEAGMGKLPVPIKNTGEKVKNSAVVQISVIALPNRPKT